MGIGLVGLLLVIGVILFVLPEPVTSGLGMTLIGFAIVIWLYREVL
jgi:hypothetical protein